MFLMLITFLCSLYYSAPVFVYRFKYLCLSFQIYLEFWYLDGLSASPLLIGGAALIRRPLVALSTLGSTYLIKRIGDLNTICFAFFLYFFSFLALSFTRIAWLVLIIDTLQAVADGISYCAFTVLFYNASSLENSSIILGIYKSFITTIEFINYLPWFENIMGYILMTYKQNIIPFSLHSMLGGEEDLSFTKINKCIYSTHAKHERHCFISI